MAELKVRRLEAGEEERFIRSVRIPFLDPYTGDGEQAARMERSVERLDTARSWVAIEDGRFVGNCGVRSMDVTVPAPGAVVCALLAMGGVTMVGVHPTHRRRGILRRLMSEMLDDCRRRGEAVAGLIASESLIYGRFGFGLASDWVDLEIDSREAAIAVPAPPMQLQLMDRDEAAKVLPALFERQRLGRPGEVSRSAAFWEDYFADGPAYDRAPGGSLFFAVGDEGYVTYRAVEEHAMWKRDRLVVEELRGTGPEVEAALWAYLFGVDLVDWIKVRRRPVDEPLRWRLADPRQLRVVEVEDRLYLRLLDVPAALEARGYRCEGKLVLDVVAPPVDGGPDDSAPGRWVLDAGREGASCRRARPGEEPDLRLGVTALGSLYLGGYPASLLAAGARVEELHPGALRLADDLFTTRPAPLTGTGF